MRFLKIIVACALAGFFLSCQADPFAKLKSNNPVIWAEAAEELVKARDARVVEPLIEGLVNGNRHMRKQSAELLGEMGDRRAVGPLIVALKDEFWEVRKKAARALGTLGDPDAIPALIDVMADEDVDVRTSGIGALKRFGGRAVEPLVRVLSSDNANLRQGAAEALDAMGWRPSGDEEALRYLLAKRNWKELAGRGAPGVRLLIQTLGNSDEDTRRQIQKVLKEAGAAAVGPLVEALVHRDSRVREGAAGILSSMGWQPSGQQETICYFAAKKEWEKLIPLGAASAKVLSDMLSDGDFRVRESAAATLAATGWRPSGMNEEIAYLSAARSWDRLVEKKGAAVGRLVAMLGDASSEVRIQAVSTLGRIADANAVGPLVNALGDPDCGVRKKVVETLGSIGDRSAVTSLLERMKDQTCDIRDETARVLESIGSVPGEPLVAALSDKNQYIREGAAMVLARVGYQGATEPLIASLGDNSARVRAGAAHVLGETGDVKAVRPLIKLLEDTDQAVREEAARSLGKLRDREAVEGLIQALKNTKDNNRYVREEAATALGGIGDRSAVKALAPFLKDSNRYVREKTADALGKLADASVTEDLVAALRDSVFKVRSSAAAALEKLSWQPASDEDRILYALAREDWTALEGAGAPAVEPLMYALTVSEDEGSLRENARRTLEKVGTPAALPLIAVVGDSKLKGRREAAEALGAIGDARAFDVLVKVLSDEDRDVRLAAVKSLAALGSKKALAPLASRLTDWWINTEVAEALARLGWKPESETDRVHVLVARRDYAALKREGQRATAILLSDAAGDDVRTVENALFAFKNMENKDVVPVLVGQMEVRGNRAMADAYLNSGMPELVQAARRWAAGQGFDIR